jgi:hypothetical protein
MAEKQQQDQATDKLRKRSPNYPYSSNRDCVELVKKLHKQEGTSQVLLESAFKHMGLRPTSSSTDRIRAALSSYKLTEEQYKNKQRFIKLTDLSHRISVDVREFSTDRLADYREAAFNDVMTKKVWEDEWNKGLPLDDATIISILRMKYNFQEEAAKRFTNVLKDNFAFCQLGEPFEAPADEEGEEQQTEVTRYNRGTMDTKLQKPPATIDDLTRVPIPLEDGRHAYIYLPSPMTKGDTEFISDVVSLYLKRIPRIEKKNEQEERPEQNN